MTDGRPRQAAGIHLLRYEHENVFCDATGSRLCTANDTASAIWELCDGQTRIDEMIDAVCLVSDVTRDQALIDFERTFDDFNHAGLIEWS